MAREQTFSPGTILVFDKGYTDFAWFADLTAAGMFFVTRLKRHADYTVGERRTPPQDRRVVCATSGPGSTTRSRVRRRSPPLSKARWRSVNSDSIRGGVV